MLKLVLYFFIFICFTESQVASNDVLGCGGYVKSEVPINFSQVKLKLWVFEKYIECGKIFKNFLKFKFLIIGEYLF